jgi:hypothetical protein
MRPEINCKADSVRLFEKGFFGNKVRQWNSPEELFSDPFDGLLLVRSRSKSDHRVWHDVVKSEVPSIISNYVRAGGDRGNLYFNEAIPSRDVTLQAEVMRSSRGLCLRFSTLAMHMRDAMAANSCHAFGLRVKCLLEHYCCIRGLDCIQELLGLYPGYVIEFTCLSRSFGDLGWNTIVWEVRNY